MKYMGCKMVEAYPAWRLGKGSTYRVMRKDLPVPSDFDVDKAEDGYQVVYPDGYKSWSPKSVFERYYIEIVPNQMYADDKPIETCGAPSVSQRMVDNFISDVKTFTLGDRTTVVQAFLKNGFVITESSSCVSPENYSEDMGREICLEKINSKLWGYLGFMLRGAVYGVK